MFKSKQTINESKKNINEQNYISWGLMSPEMGERGGAWFNPVKALVTALIWLLSIMGLMSIGKSAVKSLRTAVDEKLTAKMRKITSDDSITIMKCLYPDEVNAFCDGSPNLYYFTGLTVKLKLNTDELISIMLHEYGHLKENHVQIAASKLLISTTMSTAVMNLINIPAILRIYYTYLLGLLVNFGLIAPVLARSNKYMERAADSYPAKYGYKNAFISALKKLKKFMYSEMCPGMTTSECDIYMDDIHRWDEHPTPNERLKDVGGKIIKLAMSFLAMGHKDKFYALINKLKKIYISVAMKGTNKFIDKDTISRL